MSKKNLMAFEFKLPDGSGRALVLIENRKTQSFQVSLLKNGTKRIFTTNISIDRPKKDE